MQRILARRYVLFLHTESAANIGLEFARYQTKMERPLKALSFILHPNEPTLFASKFNNEIRVPF